MKIDVLTLFPNMFNSIFNESIIKRALDNKLVEINIHNIRDYSKDSHKKVVIDSLTRLIDGVIKKESYVNESFTNNLLDYPTYTKPRVYLGLEVPDVLVNGDHAKIDKWRYEQQIKLTKDNRPDLLKGDDSYE